ncbi:ABC transporter permease [Oscillochloris sp. ZM17-4]|uniref:ABC transporter permease n=1 Tax=Oscillochloris sp. ZM17-4 TaxID=2866714 RepID=UPI001C73A888|nr:ABC transporter permease subunit [Oscillochloris sp. ZM17-4]MBX0331493.1 ABC transporter permease [Oscillochloris sp. ZM17-4]
MIRRALFGPMLFKELATQLRGSRAALMITIYVGLILIAVRLLYGMIISQLDYGTPLISAQIGQLLFIGVSLLVQSLMVFLAPATTVHAISREHERGTFELLMSTPISAIQLIGGKLIAAMAFLLLLLLAATPVFSLVLLFGGVMLSDLARVLLITLATAFLGGTFGLCCSAITRQTANATLLCYAVLISVVMGTLFAANVWSLINGLTAAPQALGAINPLSAMATALAPVRPPTTTLTGGFRPLMLLGLLSQGLISTTASDIAPTYRVTVLLYGALSILLFWATLVAVRPRLRLTRDDGMMLAALLAYGLATYLLRGWWTPGIFPS